MSASSLGRPHATASRVPALFAAVLLLTALVNPNPAHSQSANPTGVRDIPSGDGTLQGVVRHPDGPAKTRGLAVALYALDADGSPSLRNTTTDASGAFRFENIASASGVTYLVGARYRDIPYGTRVRFEAGEAGTAASKLIEVVIDVADPTSDGTAVSVAESRIEVGWIGDSLAIQESHLLVNEGDAVVYTDPEARETAAAGFVAHLPEGAFNFAPAFGSLASDFEQRPNGDILYWGSIHPGDQTVSYRYQLPASGETVAFAPEFPSGSRSVTILIPVEDPEIQATGAVPGDELEISGQKFRTWVAGPLGSDGRIDLRLQAPEHREDPSALEIKLATVWLELDDTVLTVLVEYTFWVPPGGRLVGTADSPLLQIALPPGAELMGFSPNASRLGLQRSRRGGDGAEDWGIELLGPVPAGETQLSYRYRVPAGRAGASNPDGATTTLDLRFPRTVPLLRVMIADTGVVIEEERMHLRRPSRSGTRLYLQREAFQVTADETISLRLTPLERGGVTPGLALAPVLLGASLAAWLLVAPLRLGQQSPDLASNALSTRDRRESIYDAIRDLDHDFETGKVSQDDHDTMRSDLRRQAIELMRSEKSGASAQASPATLAPPARPPAPSASPADGLPRFCTACGGKVRADWAFCARCGKAEPSPSEAPEPPRGEGDA